MADEPGTDRDPDEQRAVDRRTMIGAAIAAATTAVVLDQAHPAAAHDADDLYLGHNNPVTATTTMTFSGNGGGSNLVVHSDTQTYGTGITTTGSAYGISATGRDYAGVIGDTTTGGAGVIGIYRGAGGGSGVSGSAGSSPNGQGVSGRAANVGVAGIGYVSASDPTPPAGPIGVYGGTNETTGIGGVFQGKRAQLRLIAGTNAGKPTTGTHAVGEIVLASDARLFLCTGAGTPGTWIELGLQPVEPVVPVIPVVPELVLLPTPERFVDTRIALGGLQGPVPAGTTHTFQLTGRDGLSGNSALRVPDTATAIVGNVTGIGQPGIPLGSFIALWPSGDRPTVSNVNFGASDVTGAVNNTFLVGLATSSGHGTVQVFNNQASDYVLDVTGYYVPSA